MDGDSGSKRRLFLVALLMFCMAVSAQKRLPLSDAVAVSGGITMPIGKGENDFPSIHHGVPSILADVNYRHYCSPSVAVGGVYAFNGGFSSHDLLRTHLVAPTLTLRTLDKDRSAFFVMLGAGCMLYADRINSRPQGHRTFNHAYFATMFTIGYEWAWSKRLSSQLHADFVMANWHGNKDYSLVEALFHQEKDGYESTETLFNPKLMFVSLGLSIQFNIGHNY